MKQLLIVLLFAWFSSAAQDKLFFANGKIREGVLVSIGKDQVFFRNTDTSAVQKISKSELLMVEDIRGIRHIFGSAGKEENRTDLKAGSAIKKNFFGVQPLAVFLGRGTFVYERLSENGNIGVAIPFSVTFNPFGKTLPLPGDTNFKSLKRIDGISFIVGADVNFYVGKDESFKFYFGPRLRYGTDIALGGLEGYTLQSQFGWMIGNPNGGFAQHFSLGFGFAHIVSGIANKAAIHRNYYGWYSLNYRASIRW